MSQNNCILGSQAIPCSFALKTQYCKRDVRGIFCVVISKIYCFNKFFSNWPPFGSVFGNKGTHPQPWHSFWSVQHYGWSWQRPGSSLGLKLGPALGTTLLFHAGNPLLVSRLELQGEVEGVWYLGGRWIFPLTFSTSSFWIENFTLSPQTKGRCEADKLILPIGYLYFGWSPERSGCFYDLSSFCLYVLQV